MKYVGDFEELEKHKYYKGKDDSGHEAYIKNIDDDCEVAIYEEDRRIEIYCEDIIDYKGLEKQVLTDLINLKLAKENK
jgi:hypothetical protein